MKTAFLTLGLFLAILAFTSGNPVLRSQDRNQDTFSLAGDWVLSAGGYGQIHFNVGSNTFTANTGCNQVTGTFYKKEDTLRIDQQIVPLTKNSCAGNGEALFLENLIRVKYFRISATNLQLLDEKGVQITGWLRKNN